LERRPATAAPQTPPSDAATDSSETEVAMDPAMLDGFPEEDKAKMMGMIEAMQTRDSLKMYNNLVERCFSTCVQSFRRKTLEKDEERCVSKCCEKFLKHSARTSVRFAELNAQSMQQMGGPPQ
jgi:import inner membrane translocase subunit TIM9